MSNKLHNESIDSLFDAILTLEKDEEAQVLFDRVLAAWQ